MIRNTSNTNVLSTSSSDYEIYETPVVHQLDVIDLSFVIPVFNEEESLQDLTHLIEANVPAGMSFEIIYIDDGSTDDSWSVIQALSDITQSSRSSSWLRCSSRQRHLYDGCRPAG